MIAPQPRILLSIQILRAIAAACVVIDHALISVLDRTAPIQDQHVAWVIGSFGVVVFFAISGLLMIETSYRDFGVPGGAQKFLLKRIVRIVPIYWLFTCVVLFGMFAGGHAIPPVETAMSFLFIPYRAVEGDMRPLLGVGWTLNYEMLFYLLFAVAMAVPRRFGLAVLFGLFMALIALGATQKSLFDTGDPENILQFWTYPLILLFPMGCLIGLARAALVSRDRLYVSPVSPALISCILIATGVGLVVLFAPDGQVFPMSLARQSTMWAMAGLSVAFCALTANPPSTVTNRVLVLLGNASYSTYLSHTISVRFIGRALGPIVQDHPSVAFATIFLGATVIGVLVHKFVEVPLLSQFRPKARLMRLFRTV